MTTTRKWPLVVSILGSSPPFADQGEEAEGRGRAAGGQAQCLGIACCLSRKAVEECELLLWSPVFTCACGVQSSDGVQ
jgi:hypothetical protein